MLSFFILAGSACGFALLAQASAVPPRAAAAAVSNQMRSGRDSRRDVGDQQTDGGSCPAVWSEIRQAIWDELRFEGCTPGAAFAIRFAFHDSATTSNDVPFYAPAAGGADGSLLLNDEEAARGDNDPMVPFQQSLKRIYNRFHESDDISAADIVQFAGSLGLRACPGAPIVRTVVGRRETSTAAPEGLLPPAFGAGSDAQSLIALFENKGFTAEELAALVGAHSVSRSFAQQQNGIPLQGRQDATPAAWDTEFYTEFRQGERPANTYPFDSDKNLAASNSTRGYFSTFAENKGSWDGVFSRAMEKMSLLGIPEEDRAGFIDCTAVIAQ